MTHINLYFAETTRSFADRKPTKLWNLEQNQDASASMFVQAFVTRAVNNTIALLSVLLARCIKSFLWSQTMHCYLGPCRD
jgi:hypothetical protein